MTNEAGIALAGAVDADRFGAKAANLARARGAGLPVPDGIVLPPARVGSLVESATGGMLTAVVARTSLWRGVLAVRSSAIGEDGAAAGFAGQHVTRLGVRATAGALRAAIVAVAGSGDSTHALAYRRAMVPAHQVRSSEGIPVAVLIQPMIDARTSGVMFTRDPVTGADELVVEAVFGLGESEVGGHVTPELWRMQRNGVLTHRRAGRQLVAVVAAPGGGTQERPLARAERAGPCPEPGTLNHLARLAAGCRALFGSDALDIEWAWAAGRLWLLQCRPITTLPTVRA